MVVLSYPYVVLPVVNLIMGKVFFIRDIPPAHLKKTYTSFRSRLEAVLAAEGGFFK